MGTKTRVLAIGGVGAVLTGVAMVALLHVVPPSSYVSPVRRTISEYALLDNGWIFDAAVLTLAVGSAAVLVALVRARLLPALSVGSLALSLWTASLALVVVFPKHNWAIGPSVTGTVHRAVSLVGFISLPVAAFALARAWRGHRRVSRHAYRSLCLGLLAYLCFSPLLLAVLLEPVTGVRWWQAIPLGVVERALALSEVAIVVSCGWWAAARPAVDHGLRAIN